MRRLIVVLLLATLTLAAAGLYVATRFEGPPEDTTAALVPADASLYASFFVDPSSDQKKLLSDRVEEAGPEVEVGSLVEDILDRVTRGYGLPYDDVQPWIDRQMALFVAPRAGGAVVVEVSDEGAAQDAMQRVGGRVLGDHAVFGDDRAVAAAVEVFETGDRASLVGGDAFLYPQAIDDVPVDRLALAMSTGGELSSRGIDLPPPLDAAELPVGMGQGNAVSLRADENGLVFEGNSYSDGAILLADSRQMRLEEAPSDAWFVAEVPNLSAAVEAVNMELRQRARVAGVPSAEVPSVAGIEGTDRALFWAAGRTVPELSVGFRLNVDGPRPAARLARSLAAFPNLQPEIDFGRDRLSARFGGPPDNETLASKERFTAARSWLGGLEPIGYVDVDAAGSVPETLALLLGTQAGRTSGYELPTWMNDVDRIVVGMDEVVPTRWRVVVSLER